MLKLINDKIKNQIRNFTFNHRDISCHWTSVTDITHLTETINTRMHSRSVMFAEILSFVYSANF